jgi:hypothetical protein
MKKINKNSMRFLPATLIAMSLLLAAVTCGKVIISKTKTARIFGNIEAAIAAGEINDEEIKNIQGRFTTAAANLKKKSIFAPPTKPKTNPVKSVKAILGAKAFINNKWYKAGDSIGEAKIVKVGSAEVTVMWNGKETKLSPISAPVKYAVRTKPEPVKDPAAVQAKPAEAVAHQQQVQTVTEAAIDEYAWIGVKLSPELKAKFLEQWNKLSDKQKAEAKSSWQAMPDGQKKMYVNQMEMKMKSGDM